MTVINAMKFNAREGGMVSDSQGSNDVRKYDFFDKVVPLSDGKDTFILLGAAGHSGFICEVNTSLKSKLAGKTEYDVKLVAEELSAVTLEMKRKTIDNFLRSNYGVDTAAAISGQGIGPHLIGEVKTGLLAQDAKVFNSSFLLIGKDKERIHLYHIPVGYGQTIIPQIYGTIGSGSDESDKILSAFVKELTKTERKNVEFVAGMAALIRATNASGEINPGVGGVSTITYFNDNGIIILDEGESRLATEIVRVNDAHLIATPIAKKCLEGLLYKRIGFEEAEKAAFKSSAGKYDRIMRFLRGYK